MEEYVEMSGGAPPSTLLVPLGSVWEAYRLLPEMQHRLLIVPVPGLHSWTWAVCGGDGFVLSDCS